MAAKDKDEQADSPKEVPAEDGEEAGSKSNAAPAAESAAGEGKAKKEGWWSRLGSEARGAVIGAVVLFLLGAVFTPVGHWTWGAMDELRDFFRGYDGKRLDDMKETIEGRPFWQEGPSFKDGAFEYVGETDIGEPVYTTLNFDSTRPRVIDVDELVNDAPNADPDPVILLGRVFDESSVKANGSHPYIYDEVILTGEERYVYVGTDEPSYPWEGIAGYVGVLMATGRVLDEDVPAGVETAYFVGVQGIDVNPNDPILQPELERLAPGKFK